MPATPEGIMAFSVPSLGIGCRYKPANVIHRDWPGEREAALACGRRGLPNQRFVLDYTGGARIERGRGNRDCCHGGPKLTPGREVEFHSIFACRIEEQNLRCKRADGAAFLITPEGGHAW